MKKINLKILLTICLFISFAITSEIKAESEVTTLCHYSYNGYNENIKKNVAYNLYISKYNDDENKLNITWRENESGNATAENITISNLKTTNGGINLKVHLNEQAITKIKNGQCPTYASVLQNWFWGMTDVCFSDDYSDYCQKLNSEYIDLTQPTNVKSKNCSYTTTDKNGKKCQINIYVNENQEGSITYKGENDNEFENVTNSTFICNNEDFYFSNENYNAVSYKGFIQSFYDKTNGLTTCPELDTRYRKDTLNYTFTFGKADDNTVNDNNNNNNNNSTTNPDVENIKNQFLGNVTCGGLVKDGTAFFTFPTMVPKLTSLIYDLLKIAIPVILVIMGMLDLLKSASAQKEDEMKKAQRKFVQRLIAGICALLVFIIVETVINLISTKTGNDNAMDCVNCFINGIDYCASVDSDAEANK